MNKNILARNILIFEQIKNILKEFKKEKIPVILLKGSALISTVYDDISLRPMEDIDILVKRDDLKKATACMLGTGYHLQTTGEYAFAKTGCSCAVDIHTDILPGLDVWKTAIELDIDGIKTFTLSAQDHIIYIIYHSMIHHGTIKNIWLEDVKRLITYYGISEDKSSHYGSATIYGRYGINWTDFVEKVKQFNLKIPVYLFIMNYSRVFVLDSRLFASLKPSNFIENVYLNFFEAIIKKKEIRDTGHLIKFVVSTHKFKFLIDFIFPEKEFLERRYGMNYILARLLRPFSLILKTLVVFIISLKHLSAD
ncbi:MAG: hypothetical protein COS68_06600 [Elusimicrobia bacterium CG06_land_8_20_14_3_00_38_11]|nr:MAG: hypothetical protein COS68_06600 [Elusimicrobia bacterium CG06_land_8_20_14_3_00_38_11]